GAGGADFLSAFELVVRNGADAALGDLLFAGLGRAQATDLSLTSEELAGLSSTGSSDPLWGYVAYGFFERPAAEGGSGAFLLQGMRPRALRKSGREFPAFRF
ncbi:MAG: hypothetical protein ACPF9T_07310, partial [Pseudomonadales bacterium]